MTQYTSEQDTPELYDVTYDEDNNPQRDLTDFVVTRGEEKISICALDEAEESDEPIVARGRIVNKGRSLKVVTAPLVEWCIEYGTAPHLWVRSSEVWYKLQKPARDYVRIHELARRRYELCSRIFILSTTFSPKEAQWETITSLLSGPYGEMKGYSEDDILLERDFILAQVKNLKEDFSNVVFLKELKRRGGRKPSGSVGQRVKPGKTSSVHQQTVLDHWAPVGLDASAEARLMKKAEKALATITKHKNAYPFRDPVDPVAHGCSDYLQRIANPMDFGTMKALIDKGNHYKVAVDIANDVRLVASNCREYNGRAHKFAVWATDLEKKFETMMRDAEKVERASMEKRINGASAKKRRVSEAGSVGKGTGGKNASGKGSRKVSTGDDPSAQVETPDRKVLDDVEAEETPCARSAPEQCAKMSTTGSKYCSDECGMLVARQRIEEMTKSGFDVASFIRASTTKSLVQARPV